MARLQIFEAADRVEPARELVATVSLRSLLPDLLHVGRRFLPASRLHLRHPPRVVIRAQLAVALVL